MKARNYIENLADLELFKAYPQSQSEISTLVEQERLSSEITPDVGPLGNNESKGIVNNNTFFASNPREKDNNKLFQRDNQPPNYQPSNYQPPNY